MTENGTEELSTEELLWRYQRSDLQAFRVFYRRTKGLVFSFLLSRLRNHADAEEALQDTYLRVHKYLLTYDHEKPAIPWLMTIARNSLINLVRKRIPTTDIDLDSFYSDMGTAANLETKNLIENALADLKPEERKLLEDRIFAEVSYEELGLKAGITAENARQRVSRLLRKMKISFNS